MIFIPVSNFGDQPLCINLARVAFFQRPCPEFHHKFSMVDDLSRSSSTTLCMGKAKYRSKMRFLWFLLLLSDDRKEERPWL